MTRTAPSTISLVGHVSGCLTIIRDLESGGQMRCVTYLCRCGAEGQMVAYHLLEGPPRKRCRRDGCTDRQRALAARSVAS